MKVSKGRGIQFFKQPFFTRQGEYAAKIYRSGREQLVNIWPFSKKPSKSAKALVDKKKGAK